MELKRRAIARRASRLLRSAGLVLLIPLGVLAIVLVWYVVVPAALLLGLLLNLKNEIYWGKNEGEE